jgi:hypothetical protein
LRILEIKLNLKKLIISTLISSGVIFNLSVASSKKQDKDLLIENNLRFEKKSFSFKMNPYENIYFTDSYILVPTIEKGFPIYVIDKNANKDFKVRTGNYKNIEEVLEFNQKAYIFGDFFVKNRLLRCLFKIDKKNRVSERVLCDTSFNLLKKFSIPERKSGLPKLYPAKNKKILLLIRNGLVFVGFVLQRPRYEYQDGIVALLNNNKETIWKIKLDKDFRPDYFYNPKGVFTIKEKTFVRIKLDGKIEKLKDDVKFFTKISKDKNFYHYYTDRLKITGEKKFVYLVNENKFYPLPKSNCKIFNGYCVSKKYFYNFKTGKTAKNPMKKEPFCMINDYFVFQENILKNEGLYVNKESTILKFYDLKSSKFVGYLKFKARKNIKESYYCWNDFIVREIKNGSQKLFEFYKMKD